MVIKKTSYGYQVKGEKGRNFSRDNLSREQAERRLREVEMFKHLRRRNSR